MSFVTDTFHKYRKVMSEETTLPPGTELRGSDPGRIFVPRRRYEEVTGKALAPGSNLSGEPFNMAFRHLRPEFYDEFRDPMYQDRGRTRREARQQ